MTDREIMQMALETLEDIFGKNKVDVGVINALRAALEQPKQKPVAWMDRDGDLYRMPVIENWSPPHTLLYTSQPRRKPLTQQEVVDGFCKTPHQVQYVAVFDAGVRFAEAAHGIK